MKTQSEKLYISIFAIFILGNILSQSLIALAGALFFPWLVLELKNKDTFLWGSLLWVFYLYINLFLKTENPADSYSALTKIPLWLLPSLFLLKQHTIQKARPYLLLLLSLGLTLTATISGYQVFSLNQPATGFFKNPIYFAYSVFPLWVITMEALSIEKKWFYGLGALSGFFSIVLAETRMIWLVTTFYLFYYFIYRQLWNQRKFKSIFIAIVALTIVGTLSYTHVPRIQEKVNRSFSGSDPSQEARWLLWKVNLELVKNNLLTGIGTEQNYIDSASNSDYQKYWVPGHKIYAHNLYLQLLVEGGIISITFFLFWVFQIWTRGTNTSKLLLTLVGFSGLTENISNNSRAFNPMLCALGLSFILSWPTRPLTNQQDP